MIRTLVRIGEGTCTQCTHSFIGIIGFQFGIQPFESFDVLYPKTERVWINQKHLHATTRTAKQREQENCNKNPVLQQADNAKQFTDAKRKSRNVSKTLHGCSPMFTLDRSEPEKPALLPYEDKWHVLTRFVLPKSDLNKEHNRCNGVIQVHYRALQGATCVVCSECDGTEEKRIVKHGSVCFGLQEMTASLLDETFS